MNTPDEGPRRRTCAWAKASLASAIFAVTNTMVNWLLILASQLDEAVEIGGISVFLLAGVAVVCAVLAVGGFYVPLILLFSHMRMF